LFEDFPGDGDKEDGVDKRGRGFQNEGEDKEVEIEPAYCRGQWPNFIFFNLRGSRGSSVDLKCLVQLTEV
jgi:hypothetical protein